MWLTGRMIGLEKEDAWMAPAAGNSVFDSVGIGVQRRVKGAEAVHHIRQD